MEFTCHDHSPRTLVIMFNRSHVSIGTPRSLFYCLFAPHICMVLFFTHIPFVVNHTINTTPPERLQQKQVVTGKLICNTRDPNRVPKTPQKTPVLQKSKVVWRGKAVKRSCNSLESSCKTLDNKSCRPSFSKIDFTDCISV